MCRNREGDISVYHIGMNSQLAIDMPQVRLMHTVQLGERIQSDGIIITPPTSCPRRPAELHHSAGYPVHILELSRQCRSHRLTNATAFYPLWRLVLA